MKIIKSKTIISNIHNYDVVLFPMGLNNTMNKGFSYELALNFPMLKDSEAGMPYGDKKKYGTLHCTEIDNIIFCACYIHNGGFNKDDDGCFLKYDELEKCLSLISSNFKEKKICSPILGMSKFDGNGKKGEIISLFKKYFSDIDIDIYDFDQEDFKAKIYGQICEAKRLKAEGKIDKDEYIRRRSELEWKRKNGILKEMPENYVFVPKKQTKWKIISVKKKDLK